MGLWPGDSDRRAEIPRLLQHVACYGACISLACRVYVACMSRVCRVYVAFIKGGDAMVTGRLESAATHLVSRERST